ncbi:N-acetyltransferase [Streptomyces alfalfae]|uniref:Acetyltransferase n=1 Tax=Streptomyces alfalfae TaxID=1642299 RepID=A0A1P8TBB8_9ACTN|nr:GNAT family N-acetyltransferase [Streptomyces alfalfae]APY84921.1 acetyltransferase [Streptomyces alfalfae]QQC92958.1 GNAT family N-acetyltransferase [Streptomyces alfalfae]QUI35261.1 GNAT family N-acetyltransferase [Streptomyces alfalfae]RXX34993.1 N-acetyltransferase [Streptomyces alfalfae]RXX45800.1 N-acetyltransferase [Streptomyces alfalfae]
MSTPAAPPERGAVALAPMTPAHLADVLALGRRVYDTSVKPYTSWSLSAIAGHLDSEASACWVALDGEQLAGFVLGSMGFDQRSDWGNLEWIACAPEYQGQGVASRLVKACCATLTEAGADAVVTDVESRNTASAALMRANGFEASVSVTLFVRENTG